MLQIPPATKYRLEIDSLPPIAHGIPETNFSNQMNLEFNKGLQFVCIFVEMTRS